MSTKRVKGIALFLLSYVATLSVLHVYVPFSPSPKDEVFENISCPKARGRNYELGNLFYARGIWSGSAIDRQNQSRHFGFQNSLGGMYIDLTRGGTPGNVSLLEELIRSTDYPRANGSTSVWHLRLGDNMVAESFTELNNYNSGHQAPYTADFYASLLQNATFTDVTLLGSYCAGGFRKDATTIKNGMFYVAKLKDLLRSYNISVSDRISFVATSNWTSVDMDVAYASSAGSFVCSRGSFSSMLGSLVKHNNGTTWGCKQEW
jgi:hypothetical protein